MSYSIIFDTHVIKATDGGYIEISRTGCNNDDEGRRPDEYHGTYYTAEELNSRIAKYQADTETHWMLRIGTRYATMKQYGDYLKRKAGKAQTWNEFIEENHFFGKQLKAIQNTDTRKQYTPADFNTLPYSEKIYGAFRPITQIIYNYSEAETIIKSGAPIEFYVKKRKA